MNHPNLRWPGYRVKPRRTIDHRVNLSSNELLHPEAAGLVGQLVRGFDTRELLRYPVQDLPVRSAGEMFNRTSEEILLAPGSDSVIRLLLTATHQTFCGRLILQDPNYEAWTTAAGAEHWVITRVSNPDGTAQGWLEAVIVAASAAVPSIVAVSWPNGPTGDTPDPLGLVTLRDVCLKRGHLLVLDGCYSAFSGGPKQLSALGGAGCLVLLSWSKMFGLAGGRLAVAIGDPDLVHHLRAFRQEDHVNALMLYALVQTPLLYDQFEGVWADVIDQREEDRKWLTALGFHTPESGTNFLRVLLRTSSDALELAAALDDVGFRVRNMVGLAGQQHAVRFTIACGHEGQRFRSALARALDTGGYRWHAPLACPAQASELAFGIDQPQ